MHKYSFAIIGDSAKNKRLFFNNSSHKYIFRRCHPSSWIITKLTSLAVYLEQMRRIFRRTEHVSGLYVSHGRKCSVNFFVMVLPAVPASLCPELAKRWQAQSSQRMTIDWDWSGRNVIEVVILLRKYISAEPISTWDDSRLVAIFGCIVGDKSTKNYCKILYPGT